MTQRRPLPRTLVPLEDESLVGLLPSLAQHTGSSPAAIEVRMGLADRVEGCHALGSRHVNDLEASPPLRRIFGLAQQPRRAATRGASQMPAAESE